jgi:ribosomal protein L11 methyltransferase
MQRVVVSVREGHAELVRAALEAVRIGGWEERSAGDRELFIAYFDARGAARRWLRALEQRLPAAARSKVDLSAFCDTSYTRRASERFEPIALTPTLVVVPTRALERTSAKTSARRKLRLEPGWCFGDGDHPSTRLAALAVERACSRRKHARLLDVGCGSGILGLVGLMSGASAATLVDVDPAARDCARHNARLNRLSARCRVCATPVSRLRGCYGVVAANLDARTIIELAPRFATLTARAGALLLTGFIDDAEAEVARAFSARLWSRRAARHRGGFALLELVRLGNAVDTC